MLSSEDLTGSWAAAWDGELVYAARMCLPWGGGRGQAGTGPRALASHRWCLGGRELPCLLGFGAHTRAGRVGSLAP